MISDLVSIIVPIYNCERFLETALESLRSQTYRNIEVILVDDGSIDGSARICREFAEKDPRFRVISKENGGVSSARNVGIEAAAGEFLQFLDADDWLQNDTTEILVREMRDKNVPLVVGSLYESFCDSEGKVKEVPMQFQRGVFDSTEFACIPLLEKDSRTRHSFIEVVMNWGRLFRSDIVKKYNLRYVEEKVSLFGEDLIFSMQYFSKIDRVCVLEKPLYHYRLWEGNGHTQPHRDKDRVEIMKTVYRYVSGTFENWDALRNDPVQWELAWKFLHSHCAQGFLGSFMHDLRPGSRASFFEALKKIHDLVHDPLVQKTLPDYMPPRGYSRGVPKMMKWKLPLLVALAAKFHIWKERKRKSLFPENRDD